MTNNAFKIGVFGLGSIGLRHAKNLLHLGHDVMAFDPSEDRQNLFVAEGGKTGSKDAVLDHANAIIIASPNQFHLDDLKLCIEHGKHAFVEKPLSHTLDGLADIEQQAKDKNLTIAVGMNNRLNPAVKHLQNKITQAEIGKLIWGEYNFYSYLPVWRPHQDHRVGYTADPKTGGIIFDTVHAFDLIYYLLGEYDVKGAVAQSSGMIDIPSDDCADIVCRHKSGITSRIHLDYITKQRQTTVKILTDQGIARADLLNRVYEFVDHDGDILEKIEFTDTVINDDYMGQLKNFIAATAGEEKIFSSLQDAIIVTQKAIEARKMAGLPV